MFSLVNKRLKNIERNFHSVAWVMLQGGLGGAGGKSFSAGICDGAPSSARCSSLFVTASLNF